MYYHVFSDMCIIHQFLIIYNIWVYKFTHFVKFIGVKMAAKRRPTSDRVHIFRI